MGWVLRISVPLLFGACALASEPTTVDRTLAVTGPVTLDVRADPGGIIITTGSSASVVVHAFIKPLYGRLDFEIAEANILALTKDPPIEQSGNHIRIGYAKDPSLLRAVTIRYEIETPRETAVQAHTESGGIRIEGITGPVEAVTSSGRTQISNVEADIKVADHSGAIVVRSAGGNVFVRNESGGIELSSIRGSVDAETTSGSIDALQLGSSIHAETTSGAIRISQVSPAAIRALSRSGAIKVVLASGAGYQLDAMSHSGKIAGTATSEFQTTKNAHSLKVQIGSGGPLVDLDTHSSKIEID